jgi:hypothetical protein
MKTTIISCLVLGFTFTSAVAENENLRAHEWGTFTTLHWPNSGKNVAWYQPTTGASATEVGELPDFVVGMRRSKAMASVTARMETPVIYFYTDKKQTVDVTAKYVDGFITEVFPVGGMFGEWKGLVLTPPAKAGDLADQLAMDPKLPDNHYFQARAVPDAAFVSRQGLLDEAGKAAPDQVERFLFYRGMGEFQTGMFAGMSPEGELYVNNLNKDFGVKHSWVLRNTGEKLSWQKLEPFIAYDKKKSKAVSFQLDSLSQNENAEETLKISMVSALEDAGLTNAEAAAMVATWDEQWYKEPGQRVFSIVPQALIDQKLPLTISPTPSELVRVFVHRQEVLSPQALTDVETAMAPGANLVKSHETIKGLQLGRFAYGTVEAVADDVAQRTKNEYMARGMEALFKDPKELAKAR